MDDKEVSCRKFNTTREMSLHMINQINKYVKEDDILFHCGDWSFSGIENILNLRKQLNVKTIHHINGNHDHHISDNKLIKNYFIGVNSDEIVHNKDIDDLKDHYASLYTKQLFTTVNDYLEIKIGKQLIVLSHYPFQSWRDISKGSIHFMDILMAISIVYKIGWMLVWIQHLKCLENINHLVLIIL